MPQELSAWQHELKRNPCAAGSCGHFSATGSIAGPPARSALLPAAAVTAPLPAAAAVEEPVVAGVEPFSHPHRLKMSTPAVAQDRVVMNIRQAPS
jgi:hypothetical protein